ncbi:MAG: phosphoadenylyl-sulfate reductase [Actinobacteria bacterium]|nr:phosphoadenylyl-sulfate reductase [Actinomycetota bacterium]
MTPVTITRSSPRRSTDDDLAGVAELLELAPAADIVRWAVGRYGRDLVMTASFQDCVLIDVVAGVAPGTEVVFLDTGYHFDETHAYLAKVRDRYDLNLRVVGPELPPDDRWRTDPDGCCKARKVEPLRRALAGKAAWLSGLRRADNPLRAGVSVLGYDEVCGAVKVNPLAGWSDDDVAAYVAEHDLPVHPLRAQGYTSIGCWPCTRPTLPGEDPREGRWSGSAKTECGLHL